MPGIPPDCDRLAEKLALLHLRLFPRPFLSSHATECSRIVGEETSVFRFKSVPTWVIANRLAHARQTRLSSWRLAYPILSYPIPCCQPRPDFYQTRSVWSMDQGSISKRSAVPNFATTVTKFCVMWEGLSLPHDTKFGNCRGDIVDRRMIFIWSLIHGSGWSGLIKVYPGCFRCLAVNSVWDWSRI